MKLRTNIGSEGPDYDPYAYEEKIVDMGTSTYTLHLGLAEYLELNDCPIAQGESSASVFEFLTGLSLAQFDRYYARIHGRCNNCGNRKKWEYADGFPGETLTICGVCHEITDVDFDRSAVE